MDIINKIIIQYHSSFEFTLRYTAGFNTKYISDPSDSNLNTEINNE